MSRLIVVSNRSPSLAEGNGTGGLAVALNAALEEHGGTWIGWSGAIVEAPEAGARRTRLDGFDLATIDLSPDEFSGYYEQHANRALWPLLHGRLDLVRFDRKSEAVYQAVNKRFADVVAKSVKDDDLVWVHDYHLIPLGAELRRRGIMAPLGFFLHTPFPAPADLAALPGSAELLADLCAYDVVGFQTRESLRNFHDAMERGMADVATAKAGAGNVVSLKSNRSVFAHNYPIGIDTAQFAELADSEAARRWAKKFRTCRGRRRWAVGVERLDYTKGLPERLAAFEKLMDDVPDLQGKLSLVQIAAPSRESLPEYQRMQDQLDAASGRINARLGGLDWTPVRYLNRSFDHTQLSALYRVSRVGVVTPLRDGMNLVAKEYVAAQDPEDPGVLVLSRFAGAAEELTGALLVNPYDTAEMAGALRRATEMPLAERKSRWARMMRHLEENDVHVWCRRFLGDLEAVAGDETPHVADETVARLKERVRGRDVFASGNIASGAENGKAGPGILLKQSTP